MYFGDILTTRIVPQFRKLVTNVKGGHRHLFRVLHSDILFRNETKLNHRVLGNIPSAGICRSRFGELFIPSKCFCTKK